MYIAFRIKAEAIVQNDRGAPKSMRKKTYLKLIEYQTEQSRKHLGEVAGIYREMRGYKHDFHHHLQTLRGQLEAGQTQRALAYLEELDRQLMHVDPLLKTGNIALDAILSAKIAQARETGICVTVKANVPDNLLLTDLELSIIVGNLLDNAIEACLDAQGVRFLRIFMGMKQKMLYFSMLNASGRKLPKKAGLFPSHKNGFHGFGLRRAEAILAEHGGWCKYNSEDGAFTSEFLVPALR
jgi:sensor histidine kinase regulating citrate/malate metabolism